MTVELTLPDMTCGHCVRAVTSTVLRVDPAATLKIDLPTQRVTIDSTQPREALVQALADEGYPAA